MTSTYLETQTLNWFRGVTFPATVTSYLALMTAAPTDAGGGTEVSGGSYARQTISYSTVSSASPDGEKITNSATITFPTATASWGTVTYYAVYDASSSGNLLFWGQLLDSGGSGTSIAIGTGDTARFDAGNLTFRAR